MAYWISNEGKVYTTKQSEVIKLQETFYHPVTHQELPVFNTVNLIDNGWIAVYDGYFDDKSNAILCKSGYFSPTEAQKYALEDVCIAPATFLLVSRDNDDIKTVVPILKLVAGELFLSPQLPKIDT